MPEFIKKLDEHYSVNVEIRRQKSADFGDYNFKVYFSVMKDGEVYYQYENLPKKILDKVLTLNIGVYKNEMLDKKDIANFKDSNGKTIDIIHSHRFDSTASRNTRDEDLKEFGQRLEALGFEDPKKTAALDKASAFDILQKRVKEAEVHDKTPGFAKKYTTKKPGVYIDPIPDVSGAMGEIAAHIKPGSEEKVKEILEKLATKSKGVNTPYV